MKKRQEMLTASNEASDATRMGHRIREIRETLGIPRATFAEEIGLNSDRVQKYENGIRKPRPELLNKIAKALGVDTDAMTDPVISTFPGFMHALFEMEKEYDLKINEVDGNFVLSFGNALPKATKDMLEIWEMRVRKLDDDLNIALTALERESLMKEYKIWQWNFSSKVNDIILERSATRRKEYLMNKINLLEKELAELEDTPI